MSRIRYLDLARGFTVLLIAPVHAVLLFTSLPVRDSLPIRLLAFVAEWQGAQVFMLLMGINYALSRRKRFLQVCKRSFNLFLGAYMLNLVKFVLPMYCHLLPAALLHELQVENDAHGKLACFLFGDILHFAALANLMLFLVYRLPRRPWIPMALALLVCLLSPLLWDLRCTADLPAYCLELLGGKPPRVFFPLMPWLAYPLAGMAIGYWIQSEQQQVFRKTRHAGWVLIIIGAIGSHYFPGDRSGWFYRTPPFDSLLHLGVAFVGLDCWNWMSLHLKDNGFFRLLGYCSNNITLIYVIQWPLVFSLLIFLRYQSLGYYASIALCLSIAYTTLITSKLYHAIHK